MKKLVVGMLLCAMVLVGNKLYAESLDISNLGFGAGISQQWGEKSGKICLESHYFFDSYTFKRDIGVGPFVFIDSEDIKEFESLGVGLMVGLRTSSKNKDSLSSAISSFNLGLGIMKNRGTLVFSTTF